MQAIETLKEQNKLEKIKKAQSQIPDNVDYDKGFDAYKKMINRDFAKVENFAEAKLNDIIEKIEKFFEMEKSGLIKVRLHKFHKNRKPLPFSKNPWTDIAKWLGSGAAKDLYKKLTGSDE